MDYVAFGRRVRQLRVEKGLTQQALAEAVELSATFLGHIERATRKASLETLIRLCNALHTDPNDLLSASYSKHAR